MQTRGTGDNGRDYDMMRALKCIPARGTHHRIRREQKKLLVKGFVSQENRDKGTELSEIGDNQVPHQWVGKGQQGIKPLPLLRFSLNFPSLRSGEMLAQYLNGRTL